mmetsp:Transcript_4035/g.6816  ORF Transcript_4035/g.6816 Transcript_4035/m.6816 type:complete len:395 (+) Transcript_4035:778-1962(+)
MRNDFLLGSVGNINPVDHKTGGGGHIHIDVDSLKLIGFGVQLSACGLPLYKSTMISDLDLNGGSGGYIYIQSHNRFEENLIEYQARIYANGGKGYNKGYGGAGGVIYFDSNVAGGFFSSYAEGGEGGIAYKKAGIGCENGASGTMYWVQHDMLYLNNEVHESTRKTVIQATIREPKLFPLQHMVAEYLFIGDRSSIDVRNFQLSEILFPTLVMLDNSTMNLELINTKNVFVKYRQFFFAPPSSLIDLSAVSNKVTFRSVDAVLELTSVEFGSLDYGQSIFIDAHEFALGGKLSSLHTKPFESSGAAADANRVEIFADKLSIKEGASIRAAKIMLFANETLSLAEGATVESLIQNECTEESNANLDFFQCFSSEFQQDHLDFQTLLDLYNEQFGY